MSNYFYDCVIHQPLPCNANESLPSREQGYAFTTVNSQNEIVLLFAPFLLISAIMELMLLALFLLLKLKQSTFPAGFMLGSRTQQGVLTHLHPPSNGQWKGRADSLQKLELTKHLEKKVSQCVSHLFLSQSATHFACKGGAANLKMMQCLQ